MRAPRKKVLQVIDTDGDAVEGCPIEGFVNEQAYTSSGWRVRLALQLLALYCKRSIDGESFADYMISLPGE